MTPRPGQASFVTILKLIVPLGLLAGCQTGVKPARPVLPATVQTAPGGETPKSLPLPPSVVPVVSTVPPQTLPGGPVPTPPVPPVPVQVVREPAASESQMRVFTLQHGRITSMTTNQWVAVPKRTYSLADSTPSLLEDASITSTVHTRLKALLTTRDAGIQCRTTAGKVSLTADQLTTEQAVTAIDEVLSFDKVREVRLSARIGG